MPLMVKETHSACLLDLRDAFSVTLTTYNKHCLFTRELHRVS